MGATITDYLVRPGRCDYVCQHSRDRPRLGLLLILRSFGDCIQQLTRKHARCGCILHIGKLLSLMETDLVLHLFFCLKHQLP
jgi:hypothetical protein